MPATTDEEGDNNFEDSHEHDAGTKRRIKSVATPSSSDALTDEDVGVAPCGSTVWQ